tara:strand:+ start:408 stop:749 length:342 start_codon:yes stop_codon:yes gene_type:complete
MRNFTQYTTNEKDGQKIDLTIKTNQDGSGTFYYTITDEIVYEVEFEYEIDNISLNINDVVDDFDVEAFNLYCYDVEGDDCETPEEVVKELGYLLKYTLYGFVEAPEDDFKEWI